MDLDTTPAVSCEVLRAANAFLATQMRVVDGVRHATETVVPQLWGTPHSGCTAAETMLLSNSEGASVATHFNGGRDSLKHVYAAHDP